MFVWRPWVLGHPGLPRGPVSGLWPIHSSHALKHKKITLSQTSEYFTSAEYHFTAAINQAFPATPSLMFYKLQKVEVFFGPTANISYNKCLS